MIWADGEEWGTAAELAARLKVSVWAVYKWRDPAEWKDPADVLPTTRVAGRVYSSVRDAARCELAKRNATRGRPRQLDTGMIAAGDYSK